MTKHNRQQTTTRQSADQEPHASTYAIPAKSDIAPQTTTPKQQAKQPEPKPTLPRSTNQKPHHWILENHL
jgi:hypothetical protein